MNETTVSEQANTANEQATENTERQSAENANQPPAAEAEQEQISNPRQQTTSSEGKEYLKITQKDLDNMMAKTRGATEREFLKSLGIESKEALTKVKESYQASLSAEERLNGELAQLRTAADDYKARAEEGSYVIEAMEAITGKSKAEVETIVKMAKGLVSEDVTISAAIKSVIDMMGQPEQKQEEAGEKRDIPKGTRLFQPEGDKPGAGQDIDYFAAGFDS